MHYILFSGKTSPLSNFYLTDFTYKLGDFRFCCSEQAYMWEKALYFKDSQIASRLLFVTSGADAKKLGRMVANFNEREWAKVKTRIMADIVLAKFSQNDHIKEYLIKHDDDTEFVECAPWDNFWGNGISIEDTRNTPVNRWPGKNMLGRVLKNVKNVLQSR